MVPIALLLQLLDLGLVLLLGLDGLGDRLQSDLGLLLRRGEHSLLLDGPSRQLVDLVLCVTQLLQTALEVLELAARAVFDARVDASELLKQVREASLTRAQLL